MVNWTNLKNTLTGGASTAKDEMTKTTRRKFLTGTAAAGATVLGADKFTDGAVSETAGNWWEEIVEDPMGLNIDTVNDYNEAVNDFEDNFEDMYRSELHSARGTDDVGRMPGHLEAGDSLDDGQYKALGFNDDDINNSDGRNVVERVVDDEEFTVLTPDAVSMEDSGFGDEFGALAINQDQNEFDTSDLRQMRDAYQEAAQVTQDWMVRVNELQTEGESLDRLSTEYEDEEEVPAVQEAKENQQYLGDVQNTLTNDHLRFRAQANLFDHALQNSPYSDGDEVGVDYDEETPTDTPTETPDEENPTETPDDSYGDHDTYGDLSGYCEWEDDTINDIHDYMDDNDIDSYDEFDVDISSTNGDFTVELTYDGDTISADNVEGCGA